MPRHRHADQEFHQTLMLSYLERQPNSKRCDSPTQGKKLDLWVDWSRWAFRSSPRVYSYTRLVYFSSEVNGHVYIYIYDYSMQYYEYYKTNCDMSPFGLVWFQVYPHKILTGRRDRMQTLRQSGGLSGFAKRAESQYDCFGAGHSSTSISSAMGMSVGKSQLGKVGNAPSRQSFIGKREAVWRGGERLTGIR